MRMRCLFAMFQAITGAALIASVVLPMPHAAAEHRVALVIGNANYKSVGALANPGNDARLLADTLRSVGFTLVGEGAQLNLDKRGFERAIETFGGELSSGDVALFFYAGHGLQVRGSNYLLPIDAVASDERDIPMRLISIDLVLHQMEKAHTHLNIVILDACRNNPFGAPGLRAATTGLAAMTAPEGTLVSYATQPGNVALDGDDGDSPYSKALARELRRPGIEVFGTFNEVGKAVLRETNGRQQPWVSTSPMTGTFYFAGHAQATGRQGK
jgi:uncharacterized caspase-like protein